MPAIVAYSVPLGGAMMSGLIIGLATGSAHPEFSLFSVLFIIPAALVQIFLLPEY